MVKKMVTKIHTVKMHVNRQRGFYYKNTPPFGLVGKRELVSSVKIFM